MIRIINSMLLSWIKSSVFDNTLILNYPQIIMFNKFENLVMSIFINVRFLIK